LDVSEQVAHKKVSYSVPRQRQMKVARPFQGLSLPKSFQFPDLLFSGGLAPEGRNIYRIRPKMPPSSVGAEYDTFHSYGAWGISHRSNYKHSAPLEPGKAPLFREIASIRAARKHEKFG
jgi:hypothetical protein